ncbi:hypothetical protein CGGC5_v010840 [Colletotrichum fructicola Nara gc5]|uniref:CorA-like transporter domain-containing protein n=1 Tax=Colletotrichum fructicola (strain Nara gc5) TaxID=1213859 RepID=A0A7J6IYL7_COLFN|nr:hypothetical protein CGGC5_v010840 [Colletotrichum fructicola Nara gc5]
MSSEPTQQHDAYDRFAEICHEFREYPKLQLQSQKPQDAFYAEQQWKKLHERQEDLFDDDEAELSFWETGRSNKFPRQAVSISDLDTLREHLIRKETDPHVRHLFIASEDSRSPLNCSMDMLKLVGSYHQIDPSFLESVHTFGAQDDPIDCGLAHFRASDSLQCSKRDQIELKRLGRSGRNLQLSYLLRSVEYSDSGSTGVWGWQIRQAANYHSFDVNTGRSFWLTIKGNDLFEKRIKDTCHLLDIPSETAQLDKVDVSPYLKASLDTHVVYLSWCDENWRSFINDVEAAVRKIVDPVNGALVDDHIDRSNGRANSWPRSLQGHRQLTLLSKSQTWSNASGSPGEAPPMLSRMLNSTSSTLGSWLKREKNPVSDPEKGNPAPEQSQNLSFISSTLDPHGTLDRFRFRDLQSLHKHADVVQKTSLVLELNIGVLRDIDDYYKYLAATEFQDTPQAKAIIEEFLREVSAISRRLETRMKQLRSLNAYLDQGMALYEKVLQQRSNQISTMFAEIAMANNQQMQQISDKTAKQTTSMHVITVATLFFLPATFVAVRATCPSIGNLI